MSGRILNFCRRIVVFTAAATGSVFAVPSTGLIPITELPPSLYEGFPGGLYPAQSNSVPAAHTSAGLAQAALVQPRNAAGTADPAGWIVMISVGMSNTTHEFAPFERQEDMNANRNARLLIVNGAHGGQTASEIRNPASPYWTLVDQRLAALHMTPQQVQVAWIKETNANPPDNFPTHAQELSADLRAAVQVLRDRFENLRVCYLSSRIYGGYAGGGLNPEPQAYESAFAVKWLIEDQIDGAADLNFDPAQGAVEAPWMAWGPYLWADGVVPRVADGLTWLQTDLEPDGTHPAPSGEQKVADLLSSFLSVEPSAALWHDARPGAAIHVVDAIEDAHISLAQPTQNFGSATELFIAPGAAASDVFLKFDVRDVSAPIQFAKLSFRVNTGGPRATVRSVTDDSWTEGSITWSNAPAGVEPPVITTGAISRDGSLSADVTQAVTSDADGLVSLRLSVPGGTGSYWSREGGQPPRLALVVQTTGPQIPATSAGGLISLALSLAAAASLILIRNRAHANSL